MCYLDVATGTFLPDSRTVVRTRTGLLAFTARASFSTKWLRLVPVRRGLVRFLGFPINYVFLPCYINKC